MREAICHMAWFGGLRWDSTGRRRVRFGLWMLMALALSDSAWGQGETGLDDLRERANAAYESGALLQALPDYERLVSLFPEEGCLHGRLAGCALREPGRLTLARRHLGIAVRKECQDVDLEFHRARLAQLEYDFDRARDLYTSYLSAAGKKARFKAEAERGRLMCGAVVWDSEEAVGLLVLDRIPADPEAAFRFYQPETPGLRLVTVPASLRSKADQKNAPGRMAFHDGDTVLVFASLGRGGKTGWDLYRMTIENGVYGEPSVLGDVVNSEYDEQDAYLSPEGILYFSSNRPGGLGGKDIYAVEWVGGAPFGQPYRLPFPINSVNDDEFFIPEPDGGAWMASNRAAKEGRIHAYRVDLSEKPVVRGTVSWVPDEVDGAGLTLRVYSGGDVVAEVAVGEGEANHMSFPSGPQDVGLRVELRDRDGDVLAESVGTTEGAWDLRRQNGQWNVQERSSGDWAAIADLRPATDSEGGITPEAIGGDVSTEVSAEPAPVWSDWVRTQLPVSAEPASAVADAGDPTLERLSEGQDTEVPASEVGNMSTPPNEGTEVRLNPDVVPVPEVLAEVLETRPEEAIAVWEAKATRVLELETDFLDNPDFNKAGELYDLISDLDAWRPDAGLVDARLQDGLQTEDISDMLDAWTYAVQSATNPALAKVAGEAALAFRREKLAVRELWNAGDPHLTPLMRRFSDWQDARRGVEGVDPAAAYMTAEEGDALMEGWKAALALGGTAWTRKQRSGWRGDWLERQQDQQALQESRWLEARPEASSDVAVASETASESGGDVLGTGGGEGQVGPVSEAAAVTANEGQDPGAPSEEQNVDEVSMNGDGPNASSPAGMEEAAGVETAGSGVETADSGGDNPEAAQETVGSGEGDTESVAENGEAFPQARPSAAEEAVKAEAEVVHDAGLDAEPVLPLEEQLVQSVRWQPLPEEGSVEDWAMLGFVFPELEDMSMVPTPGVSLVTGEDGPDAAMEEWLGKNMQVEWMESIAGDKDVRKAWESLLRAAAGQGVPAVTGSAALLELDPDVAEALVDLRQNMIRALATRVAEFERSGQDGLRDWKVWSQGHEELASAAEPVLWEPLVELAEARSRTAREQSRFSPSKDVLATFERQEQWMAAMNREAAAWLALESRTATLLEAGNDGRLEDVADELLVAQNAVMLASEATAEVVEEMVAVDSGSEAELGPAEVQSVDTNEEAEVAEEEVSALVTEGTATRDTPDALKVNETQGGESPQAEASSGAGEMAELDAQDQQGDGPSVDGPSTAAVQGEPQAGQEGAEPSVPVAPQSASMALLESVLADEVQRERMWTTLNAWWAPGSNEPVNDAQSVSALPPSDRAVLEAWREWRSIQAAEPLASASGRAVNQWEKQLFFAKKDLQQALESVDVVAFMDRLDAIQAASSGTAIEALVAVEEAQLTQNAAGEPVELGASEEDMSNAVQRESDRNGALEEGGVAEENGREARTEANGETSERAEDEAVAVRDREATSRAGAFGLVLPEAEVVGASTADPRGTGLRLRPIARTEMERAILSAERSAVAANAEPAAEAYASAEPRPEGVEYKVQVGAFRNALPAALFAAFDPMWAQRLANGVTRYMAGSFNAYDPAVVARDAIRALGYEDAFVVRFVDGERVRGSRPEPEALAEERNRAIEVVVEGAVAGEPARPDALAENVPRTEVREEGVPTRREDIPTWEEISGRVYSVQVGAFRGVPDAQALRGLGALTREDAGQDGWLRLFSGRFQTEVEAVAQRDVLRAAGRTDAFVVVYVNGRRIPLSEAATTAVAGLNGLVPAGVDAAPEDGGEVPAEEALGNVEVWFLELGAFNSTIPVRLANAILDAPLAWEIRSIREGGQTVYRTRSMVDRGALEPWLTEALAQGFAGARIVRQEGGAN